MSAAAMVGAGVCRGCGCTDDEPCFDDESGEVCGWVAADLCSFCAAARDESEDLVRLYTEADADFAIAQRRAGLL